MNKLNVLQTAREIHTCLRSHLKLNFVILLFLAGKTKLMYVTYRTRQTLLRADTVGFIST